MGRENMRGILINFKGKWVDNICGFVCRHGGYVWPLIGGDPKKRRKRNRKKLREIAYEHGYDFTSYA